MHTEAALKSVLAEKFNLCYRGWHIAHSTGSQIKGSASHLCDGGGWVKMLDGFLDRTLPTCPTCRQLLDSKGICLDSFDDIFLQMESFHKISVKSASHAADDAALAALTDDAAANNDDDGDLKELPCPKTLSVLFVMFSHFWICL